MVRVRRDIFPDTGSIKLKGELNLVAVSSEEEIPELERERRKNKNPQKEEYKKRYSSNENTNSLP